MSFSYVFSHNEIEYDLYLKVKSKKQAIYSIKSRMSYPLYPQKTVSYEHLLSKEYNDFVPSMLSIYKELINDFIPDSLSSEKSCVVIIQLLKVHSNYKFNKQLLDKLREYVFKVRPNIELYIEIEPCSLHVASPRKIRQFYDFQYYGYEKIAPSSSRRVKREHIIAPSGISETEMDMLYDSFFGPVEESFLVLIRKRYFALYPGKDEKDLYHAANFTDKQYSEIKNRYGGTPRNKYCAIALCLTVHPSLEEMKMLLSRAGYSLSSANQFDRFIECCVLMELWNVHEINQILAEFYSDVFLQFTNSNSSSKKEIER